LDLFEVSRRDKRRTFLSAVALAAIVAVLMPPVVQAAVEKVKIQGTVKTADTDGSAIESEEVPDMGLLLAEGSSGAVAVRNFAGGGGLLGAGDCTASTDPGQGPLANVVEVTDSVVTAILMTGVGKVRVTSSAIGGGLVPLLVFETSNNEPNMTFGLGNGLTVTTPLTFTGVDGTSCQFVILGQ
jgi:hypothetical protein